jgi:pimeloyl-ACP methyl ester carboxylesterase
MDAAASFDRVAPQLAQSGLRVIAPDMRGFGESDRVGAGGYYHFPDYVADLDALTRAIAPETFFVIGHSMGGTIATYFASARQERVAKLALLEGVGPPDGNDDLFPLRMKKWLDDLRDPRFAPNAAMSDEDALRRLTAVHARVPREVLATRIEHLAKRTGLSSGVSGAEADGTLTWRFDPLHRTTSPAPFFANAYRAFAKTITCPVLYVTGGVLGWRVEDEAERVASFANVTQRDIPEAGHMMHWTEPRALGELLVEFFTR